MIVYAGVEAFPCTKAVKGTDYISLYDDRGNEIGTFSGISDFSGYSIEGGDWSAPENSGDIWDELAGAIREGVSEYE